MICVFAWHKNNISLPQPTHVNLKWSQHTRHCSKVSLEFEKWREDYYDFFLHQNLTITALIFPQSYEIFICKLLFAQNEGM